MWPGLHKWVWLFPDISPTTLEHVNSVVIGFKDQVEPVEATFLALNSDSLTQDVIKDFISAAVVNFEAKRLPVLYLTFEILDLSPPPAVVIIRILEFLVTFV